MKIKEILNKVYKSSYFPFVIYTIILIVIHMFISKSGDDTYFSTICNDMNLFDVINMRYSTWSSRVIIETILIILSYLPIIIWKILNIGMFLLLGYSISKIFIKQNKRKMNYILVILLLMIPLFALKCAGWMATMNNYLWVVSMRNVFNYTYYRYNEQ